MMAKETLVLRQLQRRLGVMSAAVTSRLDHLSPDQLDDLGEALLDFGSTKDFEQWLTRQLRLWRQGTHGHQ